MPTLAELTEMKDKTPSELDGISFAPTLRGESQPERPFLYREFPAYGGQQSIRVGDWKLVKRNLIRSKKAAPPTVELFDLATDRHEDHNVADQHPDLVAKFEAIMKSQHVPSKEFPFAALD